MDHPKSTKPDLRSLADRWPSSLVSRQQVHNFSGGIITGKRMANLDSLGLGIADRLKIGRKTVYTVQSLIQFFEARSSRVERN